MIETLPVSVIIPCYNSEKTIERAIDSVLGQTMLPQEVIVVDDASKDSAKILELVEKYQSGKINFIVKVNTKNMGAAGARNVGIRLATQEYVAFLDSDDIWAPDKLETQVNVMARYPEAAFSAHKCVMFKEMTDYRNFPVNEYYISKNKELFKHTIATPTVMIRKKYMKFFREDMRYMEDFLLWIKLLDKPGIFIDYNGAYMFKKPYGEAGLSGNILSMEYGELRAFLILYKEKDIYAIHFLFGVIFSIVKFVRRMIILLTRNIIGKR